MQTCFESMHCQREQALTCVTQKPMTPDDVTALCSHSEPQGWAILHYTSTSPHKQDICFALKPVWTFYSILKEFSMASNDEKKKIMMMQGLQYLFLLCPQSVSFIIHQPNLSLWSMCWSHLEWKKFRVFRSLQLQNWFWLH